MRATGRGEVGAPFLEVTPRTMSFERYLTMAAIVAAGLAAGGIVDVLVVRRIRSRATERGWVGGETTASALHGVVAVWGALVGGYFATLYAGLPARAESLTMTALYVAAIASATLAAVRLSGGLVRLYTSRDDSRLPSTSIFVNITRIAVLAIGVLIILNALGISITPLLTALGVGGLAVALALQDTLGNLFAGLNVIASRKIQPGDYLRIEDVALEGYVLDITWRYTSLEQLPGNVIIVPNSKLASSTVINYNAPEREMSVLVQFGVAYGSDLEKVERVTHEVAAETLRECPEGVSDFDPLVRFSRFGDSSIDMTVVLRTPEYTGQWALTSEFIKRLHSRYGDQGIEIPFPITTVRLLDQDAEEPPAPIPA